MEIKKYMVFTAYQGRIWFFSFVDLRTREWKISLFKK